MTMPLRHLQFCIAPANLPFYKDLMAHLGWAIWNDSEEVYGVGSEDGTSLWFTTNAKSGENDYDMAGLNHLGFNAPSIEAVDASVAYLQLKGIALLFDTPRHRPEFTGGHDDQTYYQVMFESPDRVLIEIVYSGPK